MVIVQLDGGLGNQMDQYAVGRSLALKLNTELKLTLMRPFIPGESKIIYNYKLKDFNILEVFATPEEVKHVKETGTTPTSRKDLENIVGDVFIQGHWLHDPMLYKDIIDIIRKEFTLKKPFSPTAELWRKKILSAECSIAMHFRHGDYAYHPGRKGVGWAPILPLDYYYTCLDILKQRYGPPKKTVFIFSDNLPWVKQNLHLDVPTEFIEGCESDNEDFMLMSICKHIIAGASTFSTRAAWINSNPDRKIFVPLRQTKENVQQFLVSLTPEKKESILKNLDPKLTNKWAWIPFDFDNQPEITQQPIFSLLLIVLQARGSY